MQQKTLSSHPQAVKRGGSEEEALRCGECIVIKSVMQFKLSVKNFEKKSSFFAIICHILYTVVQGTKFLLFKIKSLNLKVLHKLKKAHTFTVSKDPVKRNQNTSPMCSCSWSSLREKEEKAQKDVSTKPDVRHIHKTYKT